MTQVRSSPLDHTSRPCGPGVVGAEAARACTAGWEAVSDDGADADLADAADAAPVTTGLCGAADAEGAEAADREEGDDAGDAGAIGGICPVVRSGAEAARAGEATRDAPGAS